MMIGFEMHQPTVINVILRGRIFDVAKKIKVKQNIDQAV